MKDKIVLFSLFLANLNYVLYNTIGLKTIEKNSIRIASIVLLIISIIIQKNSIIINKIDLTWFFFSMTAFLGFAFNDKMFNFVYLLLVLVASNKIKITKLYEYFNIYNLFLIFIVIIFLRFGITQNFQQIVGDRTRSTFGFNNVNTFANLMYSMLMIFLLSRRNLNILHYLLTISILATIYKYTDTRSVLFSMIIFITSNIILKFFLQKKIISKHIIKYVIIIICMIPVTLSMFSSLLFQYYPELDKVLSARLTLNNYYIKSNSIKRLIFGGTSIRDVDNGYLLLLYSIGLLFFVFTLILIIKSIPILIKRCEYKSISFIISFMYFTSIESLLVRPELFITILFWMVIYKSVTEKNLDIN